MKFWSCHRPSRNIARLALAVLALSLPAVAAQAQVTTHAALNATATIQATPAAQAAGAPAANRSEPSPEQVNPPPKTLTAKAVDTVKQVAKSATDIFGRVPCLAPKGGVNSLGSLPRVANKLIAAQPVLIVAFGSSSTQGYGASAPDFTYPNRLAAQLKRQYPSADITVVN